MAFICILAALVAVFICWKAVQWAVASFPRDRIRRRVFAACNNPGCVRCHRYVLIIQYAFNESIRSPCSAGQRLTTAIRHIKPGLRLPQEKQRPTLFAIPNLPSQPFPNISELPQLQEIALEATPLLKAEYDRIAWRPLATTQAPWRSNQTPCGSWTYLSLINQGTWQTSALPYCPVAMDLLQRLAGMRCHDVFANALYSVLSPGSSIEPHCGPTNARWRLHIPLSEDEGAIITVAGLKQRWCPGQPFLIDDSFEHSVEYRTGQHPRVVFIVDVYPSRLTQLERHALRRWFAPGLDHNALNSK
eukprot:TRINITY_DN10040_c0_g1_i2.p1 TRINITY_DN10040_c0_g1~~TRINITY_DN10040_c0_g1_i2.p1  ORF type:complete len:303 (+),score=25.39 TRINITY_DN10040_c0_g1_i2:71-979(+)